MKIRYMVALLIFSLVPSLAVAETAEEKGKAIAEEADRRDLGWKDNRSDLKMILRNRHGQESRRKMRRQALESTKPGRGDKSLVIFDTPRDIRGTAFLSHTKILKPDDQWLYLPALKRVKRISSANKSGPFVGSEFAYEDLLSQEVDKYSYKWFRDEPCGDLQCFVVERYPLYKNSGYARQVVWWDKHEYRIQKIDFYDRKNAFLKSLIYENYRLYLDKYWRAHVLKMENHQTGKGTDLLIDTWEFRLGQNKSLFTPARLKRAR
jgi:hypothetical protein